MLVIFVDGVGIGPDDPATNPFASAPLPHLTTLAGQRLVASSEDAAPVADDRRRRLFPLEATLGVAGLPQSATGQTTLLTGLNAAAALGAHLGPYPNAELRMMLGAASLWRRLKTAGKVVAFANAFPDRYLERVHDGRGRMGAIARSAHLAGVTLRGHGQLASGEAVSAFLTNEGWRTHLGHDVPEVDEFAAGRNLAELALAHDFTLFEHYATDIAGHRANLDGVLTALSNLDRFVGGVRSVWPIARPLLIVSDHGNIEDLSHRRHTLNPALGIWAGPAPAAPTKSLVDVAAAVLGHFGVPGH